MTTGTDFLRNLLHQCSFPTSKKLKYPMRRCLRSASFKLLVHNRLEKTSLLLTTISEIYIPAIFKNSTNGQKIGVKSRQDYVYNYFKLYFDVF